MKNSTNKTVLWSFQRKKWLNLLPLIFMLFITFTGCKQENNVEISITETDGFLYFEGNKANLITSADSDDEVINKVLMNLSEILQEVVTDKDINKRILELAKEYNNEYIPLRKIVEEYPQINGYFPSDKFQASNYEMIYRDITYEPVINIPNIDNADYTLNPLLSPGFEVEDNDEKGIDDFVFSWYLTDDGTFKEVIVGEEQGVSMKNPLFVISPHPVNDVNPQMRNNMNTFGTSYNQNSNYRESQFIELEEFQVKDPNYFENTGRLEFYTVMSTTQPNSNVGDESFVLECKVERSDVASSTIFTPNQLFGNFSNAPFTTPDVDYYALSYERDWIRSSKAVDCSCSCNNGSPVFTYTLFAKMRYANDVYNRDCWKAEQKFPNIGSKITLDNTLGRTVITRVDD